MNILMFVRGLGLLVASVIGLFRLIKNHLKNEERLIYVLATLVTAYMGAVFAYVGITDDHSALGNVAVAWFFLVTLLISFMLYYRRTPRLD